jgi:hypothetical protein
LCNVKGKELTEREWRRRDTGSAMRRGKRGDGKDDFEGSVEVGDLETWGK